MPAFVFLSHLPTYFLLKIQFWLSFQQCTKKRSAAKKHRTLFVEIVYCITYRQKIKYFPISYYLRETHPISQPRDSERQTEYPKSPVVESSPSIGHLHYLHVFARIFRAFFSHLTPSVFRAPLKPGGKDSLSFCDVIFFAKKIERRRHLWPTEISINL